MKEKNKEKITRHILVAVVGMTPQVVTETLYALMVQQGKRIDEIILITTAEGKEKIWEVNLAQKIRELCVFYKKKVPAFSPSDNIFVAQEESVELFDIRTDKENQLFPNLIVDVIKKLTADSSTQLFCSIAGGRKTMSVAMAFALSLFGRKNDLLSHVLVSKQFEQSGKFFPRTKKECKEIVLANVPYIRLREKLPLLKEYPTATFGELVQYAQTEIDKLDVLDPLIFFKAERTVQIGGKRIKFQPFDFALYLFVAKSKDPVPYGKDVPYETWNGILTLYKELFPSSGQIKCMECQKLTKSAAKIRGELRKVLGEKLASKYALQTKGEYGNKWYEIEIPYEKRIFR